MAIGTVRARLVGPGFRHDLHFFRFDSDTPFAMTAAARKQLERALDLSDDGRLAIASALLENVGGSRDSKWDAEWMKEQDRHYAAARASGPPHAESSDADLSAPCRVMMS